MPIPRVAIVGRPNVGKSSLLNMLAGAKVSIVDPTPGTTRDRVSIIVDLPPPDSGAVKPVEIVDTGGFGVYVADGRRYDDVGADLATLTPDIEFQIAQAIESADLVLFAVDSQSGITPQDLEIARLLREQRLGAKGARRSTRRVPVRVAATKVDGPKWEAHAHELAGLGLGDPLMCSAKNNYMRRDFTDALYEILPEPEPGAASPVADLSIAIVGKRNAGKSTLVNTLAGQPRVIVSEIAGTTRDAIDVRFEMGGRSILAIDTAGVRRKKSLQDRIEHFAFDRVQRAIARADVVLVLIDATEKVSQVDEQVAMLTQKAFKPAIIVVNKWDLAEGQRGPNGKKITTEDYETYLRAELAGLSYAPIAFISARDDENVRQTIELAFEIQQQAGRRVTTGRLNRLLEEIIDRRGPSSKLGTRAKMYYVAQVGTHPPTILAIVNKPELFTPNYQKFLLNRFREALPFSEVPIRLLIRGRTKGKTVDETVAAARHGLDQPGAIAEPGDADAYFED